MPPGGRASRRRCSGSAGRWRLPRTSPTRCPRSCGGLAGETRLSRIWFGRQVGGREVIVADTGSGPPPVAPDPRPAHQDAGRPAGPLGPGASAPGPPRRSNRGSGNGAVPGEDRGRRGDAGLDLGNAGAPGRPARSRGDAPAQPCRRPDRARLQAREAGRDGQRGRDRAAERGAQGRAPRLRVPRPPNAAGRDPRCRRQPDGPGGRLDGRRSAGRRRRRSISRPIGSTGSFATCWT